VAALTGGIALAGLTSNLRPIGDLTFREFAALVGKPFLVQFKGRPALSLRLAAARPLPRPAGAYRPAGEGFRLLFEGPTEQLLPQDSYRLESPGLGSFDIFLVPIGPSQGAPVYEAVVNRFWR